MYTRSYYPDENKINIPENYDGNAFSEDKGEPEAARISAKPTFIAETKISPREEPIFIPEPENDGRTEKADTPESKGDSFLSSVFKRLPFSNILPTKLGGIFKNGGLKIGSEEILIIAVALFLLFSKDGDRECALMLLGLLLIG